MAPTPRPGLETNDIAFPTPGNQMEILCVLSKTDELSNNETTLLWTILSSSGPMQLEKQIWSDWWAIRKVLLHWREEEDNYKSYFSEVQKEIMTKLAIVRSIKMIKLMNLTRTIHALKTKKENNQNYYFVLHSRQNRKTNKPDYYCIEENIKITSHQNYYCILLDKLFLQQLQHVWRFWLFSQSGAALVMFHSNCFCFD